eukprot:CFRG2657T1
MDMAATISIPEEDAVILTVFSRLEAFLDEKGIAFAVKKHKAVFTSEEAAAVRGATLSSGAKALICSCKTKKNDPEQFILFVVPADRKLESKLIRRELGMKGSVRFATVDEVFRITGLLPGSIPPFGGLFGLKTVADIAMKDEKEINFNAGDHCISINMTLEDYKRAEEPEFAIVTNTPTQSV